MSHFEIDGLTVSIAWGGLYTLLAFIGVRSNLVNSFGVNYTWSEGMSFLFMG